MAMDGISIAAGRSGQSRGFAPKAALELLKPITWFAPMWAFGCGIVSAGVPAGRWYLIPVGVAL